MRGTNDGVMNQVCKETGLQFSVDETDLDFYGRISPVFQGTTFQIPPPARCPAARLQRRLTFRNQTHVYFRKSARSGASVFSSYPEPSPFPVVTVDEWWGEDWDELQFGIDFDPDKPFFPQFEALRNRVPHLPLSVSFLENSDYCSNASYLKDCYLVFNSSKAEDCIYCEAVTGSKSCIDCSYTKESELCYDCTMCIRCYNCRGSLFSTGCRDSLFLMNCVNCSDCFGCVNLRSSRFCFFNRQLTEAEYQKQIARLNPDSWTQYTAQKSAALDFWRKNPRPNVEIENSEGCSGNFIYNSKGVKDSFFIRDCEDVRYSFGLDNGSRDCQDITIPGFNSELCYQGMIVGFNTYRCLFSYRVAHNCSNLIYCWLCFYSNDCFGCVGLRKKQYCIFNKQYSKDEYERLVPQIISKMQLTGEWGEYFPAQLSAIPYNLSFAQRYFPQSREAIEKAGLIWGEENSVTADGAINAADLPDSTGGAAGPLTVRSLRTETPFRITKDEITRYNRRQIALPRLTYRERMDDRFSLLGGVVPGRIVSARTGQEITAYPAPGGGLDSWLLWDREDYIAAFAG